ncbi:bd7fb887-7f67-4566-91a5-c0775e48c785-CDS [Sclerotinia trifoliorum]|uniref:tRNA (guanine(9)-N1)-methyltransferase n=1 Tax=Sclerotinia trifoliorum TaxID=28548 RepID=A0A8H2W3L7_9HELO|nr:bd7fb887-7f67-4566-91a5-c0775e48c785-CDS [Sclerotinia trifoliorum]
MSDIDERPSKIRKVGSTDNASASGDVIPLNSPSNDITMELETSITTQDTPTNINSNTTESSTIIDANQANPLSKSQIKKRRKQEEWEANKSKRAEFRRIKRKEKQARKAAAHASGLLPPPPPQSSRRPIQVPVAFLIDCDFESYMMEKEIISLTAQVTRCYSDNRTAVYRGHMGIAGWGGKMKERFEGVLAGNFNSWKGVRFMEEGWLEAAGIMDGIMKGPEGGKLLGALATKNGLEEYKKPVKGARNLEGQRGESRESTQPEIEENLEPSESVPATSVGPETTSIPAVSETSQVPEPSEPNPTTLTNPPPSIIYLTSDSPNTLTTLTPNTTYIIGGIVDKNRHKGLCYKRACDAGVATAKLPIGEYMTMQSRTVLTVNHVMEIMIRWLETGDWGEAFLKVIPKRKEAKLRTEGRDGNGEEGEGGHDEEHDEHDENENENSGDESEDGEEGGVAVEAEQTGEKKVSEQSSKNDTTIAGAK